MMGSGYGMGTGQGMGPGMMNGPGMMGRGQGMGMSPALPSDLDEAGLSSEQRAKIQDIRRDFQRKQWKAMESMHEAMWQRSDEMRKQIDAVLTPEQRQKLGRNAN
jgi:Spy/CpxP family protein refolding chaperone